MWIVNRLPWYAAGVHQCICTNVHEGTRHVFFFIFLFLYCVHDKLLLVINIPADLIWEFFLLYIFRYWSFWLGDVSCQLQLDRSNVLHWEREIGYWVSERKINSFSLLLQSHSYLFSFSRGVLTFICKWFFFFFFFFFFLSSSSFFLLFPDILTL